MPGLLGGRVTGATLRELESATHTRDWYGTDRTEAGEFGLALVHHGDRDPGGRTWWADGRRAGAVHGAVTNREAVGETDDALLSAVLDRPGDALPAMDGPFVVGAVDADADRAVVAVDKLGSRPCYYTTDGEFAVASSVRALLPVVDEPTPDRAAIADMLLMGHVYGDKTLVEEVRRLPASTLLEYDGGRVRTWRYWQPDYGAAGPSSAYVDGLADRYRDAVTGMADTVDGTLGVWLSGGLDSRSMAAVLTDAIDGGVASDGNVVSDGNVTSDGNVASDRNVASDGGVTSDEGGASDGGVASDGGARVATRAEWAPAGPPEDLVAYTYRANPPGEVNPAIAGRVADSLGIDQQEVPHGPEVVAEHIEEAVALTDGMLRWSSMVNMMAAFALPDERPGVVVEAAGQGELLGEHLLRYHYTECDSVAQALYHRQGATDAGTVRDLLRPDLDPLGSLRAAGERAAGDDHAARLRDAHLRNHYARFVFASNPIARSLVGLRTPFADGSFLRHVARLPLSLRMGSFPLTRGRVPYGASKPKLALVRALDDDLAAIPYERTSVPPARPYPLHVAGFAATTASRRLRSRLAGDGWGTAARWIRDDPTLREWTVDRLADAADRPTFERDTVNRLRREHLDGDANHASALTSLTAVELWLQRFVDGR